MVDPKISVSADVSGIKSALESVQKQVQKINQMLSSGEVGIDVKQAKSDLSSLDRAASALAKQFEQAAKSGAQMAGADFASVADALGEAVDAAGSLNQVLDAVGQSSGLVSAVKNSKALIDNLNRARRSQELLAKDGIKLSREQAEAAKQQYDKWRQSGARGTTKIRNVEFDDWLAGGWRNYSMDESESRRHRSGVLKSVGIDIPDTGHDKITKGWTGFKQAMANRGGRAGAMAGAAGGMAGSMLQGGDGGMFSALGGGAGTLIGGAAGFMFGGPIGAVAGAAASQLLGGLGSTIDAAIQRVIEQNSGITDLRRSLGATTTDFDALRDSVMYFTEGLGLTGDESVRLARSFAEAAGKTMESVELGRSVGGAAGFARGYGMDPSAAMQFFGAMRHFGASSSATDDKRIALLIGEAVARNNMNPKMAEVMSALQSYVETQTRSSLTSANTSAYTSFLSAMTGQSLTGLKGDPTTAATAMSAADAALRRGGAFGEASRMFSLGIFQRMMPGFNALNMGFVQDQGAFGTLGRAFGEDSPAMAMARALGDKGAAARYRRWGSGRMANETILSMQMRGIEQFYGAGGVEAVNSAIQNHFGVSAGQASALFGAYKTGGGIGGLQDRLKAAGVDISTLDPKRIAALAQIDQMDGAGVRREAQRLIDSKELSEPEEAKLNALLKEGTDQEIKKQVLELTGLHDTTKDLGEKMRQQQASMVRSLDKIANELVPVVGYIKDAMLTLVQKIAPESDLGKRVFEQEQIAANKRMAPQIDKDLQTAFESIKNDPDPARKAERIRHYNEGLHKRNNLIGVDPSTLPYLDSKGNPAKLSLVLPGLRPGGGAGQPFASAETRAQARQKVIDEAKRQGLNDEQISYLLALVEKESMNFNPNARGVPIVSGVHKGKRATGLFQIMPATAASAGIDAENIDENIRFGVTQFKKGWSLGGVDLAIAQNHHGMNNGRYDPNRRDRTAGITTGQYVSDVKRRAAKYRGPPKESAPPPAAAAPAAPKTNWQEWMNPEAPESLRLPPGHKKISALDSSHQVIEHRVTVLDGQGLPHYNSTTQTRIGHPVPAGMA